MFVLDTKLQTQRWYVIKGWADPIPLVEMPAESPVSSRIVAGPSLDCDTAWAPLIRAGVTDADGWVYAHNCTAFAEIGKDGELKVQHAESALRASAHHERGLLDYCRQRTWLRRRPFVDASSASAVPTESDPCAFELVGVRRGEEAIPVHDGGSADKQAGHFHSDAESSEDEHADEHKSAASAGAALKRQNATIADQPQLVHLRNKSNAVLYAALYARAAMSDATGTMGYRRVDRAVHELGFNRCLAVQPCGSAASTSGESSIVVIVSSAPPAQWSNFYASGQLSDGTGEFVYIPVVAGDFKKVFLIADVVSGRTTHPAQMLGNVAAADGASSSASNTVVLVSALSSWQWAIQKRTGHWESRQDAMSRDNAHRKRVHAAGQTAKMASVCDQTATAAPRPGLCAEEDEYAARRWVRCQAALRRFLAGGGGGGANAAHSDGLDARTDAHAAAHSRADQIDARDLPRIGFCYSGGGVRALINGLGATLGADAIGLHDAVLYSSGLSGGSWFLALFTQRPMAGADESAATDALNAAPAVSPMDAFLASLRAALSAHPGIVGPQRLAWVWSAVRRVAAFKPDREVSLADVYGLLIAMQWLHTWREPSADRMAGTLSDQVAALAACDHAHPIPIYNAVHPDPALPGGYEWFEFTPWAVRSLDSCVAIPAWAFGRRFAGGRSVETCPEFPLGVLLGMFGSAFCASIEEMESNIGYQSPLLFKMLRGLDAVRLVAPMRHYNPAFGIGTGDHHASDTGDAASSSSSLPSSSASAVSPPPSAIAHKPTIELIDAGCCVNAPLPPLLRAERALDIVFVLDARPTDFDANDSKDVLRKWEAFARAKGQLAPRAVSIAYAGIGARSLTVIEDDEQRASGAPTLVYMPLVRSEVVHADFDPAAQGGWAAFDAFSYREEHFDVLLGLARHNFVENERAIRELLWTISERKRERRLAAEAGRGGGSAGLSS